MSDYMASLKVLEDLFSKDCTFNMATAKDNVPSVRVVDTYFDSGVFWIVTYANSNKVIELESNPNMALCDNLYSFKGKGYNTGHPLDAQNSEIREKLIKVFEPWYFAHNNEAHKNMCYVKFIPEKGFFFKDGTGYKADFEKKEVEAFPFESHLDDEL